MEAHGILRNKTHNGVVIDATPSSFDQGSATLGSVFVDENNPREVLIFYSGSEDRQWSHSAIGLAITTDLLKFQKLNDTPLLEGGSESFCSHEATTPVVTLLNDTFYMFFAGKSATQTSRKIGVAYADDPKGPWNIIGELIKPTYFWEGNNIDIGPSIARIDDETVLLYYSSITSPKMYDIGAFIRRYPIRRIGILKVRIRRASLSGIEAMRFSGNPLRHINNGKGTWNESVFCPGYIKIGDTHYLFPAGSTYSAGYPYKQYVGLATSNSPYFPKGTTQTQKLIDGRAEKTKIIPNLKGELALDTPCPYLDQENHRLYIYYSVADRADEIWKIALTTYDVQIEKNRAEEIVGQKGSES